MSNNAYRIQDQHATHFLTMTVVNWIDIFSRDCYRQTIVDSLNHCIANKGLILNAWVIMSNHIHLVARSTPPHEISSFIRDFKKFTSKKIAHEITNENESRRKWMLNHFHFTAQITKRADQYKIWQDGYHGINLSHIDAMTKVNYIHENPVKNGLVRDPENYVYSSAIDYSQGKGLIDVEVI